MPKELQCAHGWPLEESCEECDALAYGCRLVREEQLPLFQYRELKDTKIKYIDPPCRCNAYDFPHYHPEGKRYSDVYRFGKAGFDEEGNGNQDD
jgi:hypothetical protein